MTTRIVFVADDFGLDAETNAAIVHAHRHGVLTSAALMLGQPGTDEAVALARATPSLELGWHLHLSDSRPLTAPAWPWGASAVRAGFALGLSPAARRLASREIARQWQAFEATGLACRFVNAHHHLHWHPFVRGRLLATLPRGFGGWLRWGRPRFFTGGAPRLGYALLDRLLLAPRRGALPVPASTTLWGLDRTFAMDAGEVASAARALGDGLHEFLFHPRRAGGDPDSRCLVQLSDLLPAE